MPDLIKDYDAIGFDTENCLIKYNVEEMIKVIVYDLLDAFHKHLDGYPIEIISLDFSKHKGLCMNHAVWDIANGAILKLVEGRQITHAVHGLEVMSKEAIIKMYGDPPIFT